jgi:hypothetical protein
MYFPRQLNPMKMSSPTIAAMGIGAIAAQFLLAGACNAGQKGVPALYPTKAEAETAAKLHFNCTGAHSMGTQWMPCASHGGSQPSKPSGSKPSGSQH